MSDELNKDVTQIGDICPHCNQGKLRYVWECYPHTDEHLECSDCNSTYLIKYKQMWNDDINSLSCDMHDALEKEFKERGMKLTNQKSDEIYEKIQKILEEFGTGDYRNYH